MWMDRNNAGRAGATQLQYVGEINSFGVFLVRNDKSVTHDRTTRTETKTMKCIMWRFDRNTVTTTVIGSIGWPANAPMVHKYCLLLFKGVSFLISCSFFLPAHLHHPTTTLANPAVQKSHLQVIHYRQCVEWWFPWGFPSRKVLKGQNYLSRFVF